MCYKYIKTTISLTKSARVVENYNNKLRINWILTIRHAFSMETNHCVVILLDLFSAELILPMSSRNTKRKHKLPVSVCYQKLRSWSMSSFIIDFKPIVLRAVCCVQVTIQLTYQKVNHSMNYIPTSKKAGSDRPKQTRHKTALLPTIRHCHRHHKIHSNRVPAP